ncbi:type I secretion system permease/ATPase [Rhizobium sullae]|uniref:ATP-binding cassette subfamily C protein/ATP-binding cassette subfamily C exporter for protease/lipase/ATP-binding cassette subfamily C protein EexD n=1 Tax=Rhizobium sullae TaxID=50338 RepID=A0A4R3PWJ1_RHISU|nr:type I secretion system permease/ATPase [Rhizobium sullae]TCU06816.1 ATP-binding cassette subfamily C protein/ATP-binding cassette subfamily C exporter for protease/lipase/ATP-binding cassette subfamily C protein EexD [Rhizobium sullae]
MRPSAFADCMQQMRSQMPAIVVFSVASNLLTLISSIYMMQVFDRILSTGSYDTLFWLTFAALVGLAAFGALEHVRRRMLARAGTWFEARLSTPVIKHCMDAHLAGLRSEASYADISDLKAFISGEAILAFLDAPWMPLFIFLLWFMHPALGILALCGAVLLFGLAVLNEAMTRRKSMSAAGEFRSLQQDAQQLVEQADSVRPLGMVSSMLFRWKERQKYVQENSSGSQAVTELISTTTKTTRMALQILIMGIGAYLVLKSELTSGGMIASSIILGKALSPVERALGAWRGWVSARKARSNLVGLFGALPEEKSRTPLPVPAGRLTIQGLRYGARGVEEPILKRLDLAIEPGTTCGIIGASGSGKSTLCRLIVGAWKPSGGHVRLDGADVSIWDSDELGRHVGYLPQEPKLFPGTIAENIARMGRINAEAVARAARLADVHQMILRLPQGYETDVGAQGHKLSGGQRQRIALARAFYGDPVLLVLDEPNANLDGQGEDALLRALLEQKQRGKTILIVAHQPSALRTADMLVVLGDGIIQSQGPRNEVLRNLTVRPHSSQHGAETQPSARPAAAAELRAD